MTRSSLARAVRLPLPVALLATGACFATRSDVRILQGDIMTLRQEAARADTARARQIAQVVNALGVVGDSLRESGARLTRYQGENRGEFRAIGQQMLQLQELVGQSQVVLQRLRAENEARLQQQREAAAAAAAAQPQVVPPVTGVTSTDTATRAPAPAPVNPGPNQLLQDGLAQARRGSYSAAQAAFEELLRLYPSSDVAPDAQYYLGEAYDYDGKAAQADSAFQAVALQYPKSPRAPTAMYKLALSMAKRGRRADARAMMDRVVREYPGSDAAELAAEWLRTSR